MKQAVRLSNLCVLRIQSAASCDVGFIVYTWLVYHGMDLEIKRRRLLSTAVGFGVVPLTGCLGSSNELQPGTLQLINRHHQEHVMEIEISKQNRSKRDEFTIPANAKMVIKDYVPYSGRYRVVVEFDSDTSLDARASLNRNENSSSDPSGYILRAVVDDEGEPGLIKTTPKYGFD